VTSQTIVTEVIIQAIVSRWGGKVNLNCTVLCYCYTLCLTPYWQ